MVKHVVLFKLKETLSVSEKSEIIASFKDAIERLPSKIDFIRHIEVGGNINPSESFDIALYSEFDNLEDVSCYVVNPDHVAAAGIIKPYIASRSCVDYEY